ncbi:DUF1559 domain-containing protein [Paludisphaera mucosa]|uniref:DUF1559 domain-containing protein n=1 Tax=Paludisphaera mucosa TaxID=3030827 RepID=A0ABT6F6E1_9BACT|nr:DUF1559 domain-containing protein [Paludisphaera mucosa]MDG3003158.1 DUF1559 domain-containing protein [Paludisphaera mucosa]
MEHRIGLLLACLVVVCGPPSTTAYGDVLETFLDDQVAAVCRIRLDRVDAVKLGEALGDAAAFAKPYAAWIDALRKAGAHDLYILATLENLPPRPSTQPVALVPLVAGADAQAIGALLCGGAEKGGPAGWTTCASIRGAVLAGDDAALDRARNLKAVARPDLVAALESAGDVAAVAAFAAPGDLRRVVDELTTVLPAELGGGPTSILTRGLKWATASLQMGPSTTIRLLVQAEDASAAKELAAVGGKGVQIMLGSKEIGSFVPQIKSLAEAVSPRIDDDRIVIDFAGDAASRWARAFVDPMVEANNRATCMRNLMQIALAMHNYLSVHGTFPPAYLADAAGKPLLSWRVLILPYLEQDALYKEFHLNEPWDSPHNKALVARMPEVLACPSKRGGSPPAGTTIYKTPRGAGTAFTGPVGITIKDVTDGTSNTIMVLETPLDQAVVWTRPDDWDVPANLDPKAVLTRHLGGAHTALMDGSVRFLRDAISAETLRSLLTPAGGEVVGPDS